MPVTENPTTEQQARGNALASALTAVTQLKPADALDAEAITIRLAHWIMTGQHADATPLEA